MEFGKTRILLTHNVFFLITVFALHAKPKHTFALGYTCTEVPSLADEWTHVQKSISGCTPHRAASGDTFFWKLKFFHWVQVIFIILFLFIMQKSSKSSKKSRCPVGKGEGGRWVWSWKSNKRNLRMLELFCMLTLVVNTQICICGNIEWNLHIRI